MIDKGIVYKCEFIREVFLMLKRCWSKTRMVLSQVKRIFFKYVLHFNQLAIYFVLIRWVRHLFRADVVHVKVHHRKLDRPVVVVSNHVSGWDPFLILSALPSKFFFAQMMWRLPAYHGFFKQIWYIHYRIFFRLIGVYPIEPKGDLTKSLDTTIEVLRQGHSTVFFPQGKRVMDNEEVQPKKGIAHLLKHVDVYLLPVHVSYDKLGKNGFGAKVGPSRVVIGDLIKSEHFIERYDDEIRHLAIMQEVHRIKSYVVEPDNIKKVLVGANEKNQ